MGFQEQGIERQRERESYPGFTLISEVLITKKARKGKVKATHNYYSNDVGFG